MLHYAEQFRFLAQATGTTKALLFPPQALNSIYLFPYIHPHRFCSQLQVCQTFFHMCHLCRCSLVSIGTRGPRSQCLGAGAPLVSLTQTHACAFLHPWARAQGVLARFPFGSLGGQT